MIDRQRDSERESECMCMRERDGQTQALDKRHLLPIVVQLYKNIASENPNDNDESFMLLNGVHHEGTPVAKHLNVGLRCTVVLCNVGYSVICAVAAEIGAHFSLYVCEDQTFCSEVQAGLQTGKHRRVKRIWRKPNGREK